jgi:cyclic pyranopterin phosphate synthase
MTLSYQSNLSYFAKLWHEWRNEPARTPSYIRRFAPLPQQDFLLKDSVNRVNLPFTFGIFQMNKLTHLDEQGHARMVDVGGKAETARRAIATGRIRMSAQALTAIRGGEVPKGDVLAAARIAGIMGAKKTGELIPLCHPLALDAVTVDFAFEDGALRATATASLTGRTGVEMEAMTAVSIALLTIYDMGKALDKGMVIDEVRLLAKSGGKSGDWQAKA